VEGLNWIWEALGVKERGRGKGTWNEIEIIEMNSTRTGTEFDFGYEIKKYLKYKESVNILFFK
jgi:hypothetical protein